MARGRVDNSGGCVGNTYQEKWRIWNNAVIAARLQMNVRDYQALIKQENNEVILQEKATTALF